MGKIAKGKTNQINNRSLKNRENPYLGGAQV